MIIRLLFNHNHQPVTINHNYQPLDPPLTIGFDPRKPWIVAKVARAKPQERSLPEHEVVGRVLALASAGWERAAKPKGIWP